MPYSVRKPGFSLLELLVAMAVLALLLGLTLAAVSQVRAEAARQASANNLRQIHLALIQYAETERRWPTCDCAPPVPMTFFVILPYLDPPAALAWETSSEVLPRAYRSPADPTLAGQIGLPQPQRGDISYAGNREAFPPGTVPGAFCPDGLSNTIGFVERYAKCARTAFGWSIVCGQCLDAQMRPVPCVGAELRRPTFADPGFDDVLPVATPSGTVPSVPGRTFQVRPAPEACDYRVPQTPHAGGMLTAYLDGSVRTTRPGVEPAVFWAAVTPAGGEVGASLE